MAKLNVIEHPLVQHKLSLMRKVDTSVTKFRTLLAEISMLLAYEVTRDMKLSLERIQTPLTEMDAPVLDGKKIVLCSVLRAGSGIVDGMIRILPSARIGHVGLYRDPVTFEAVEYYFKMPSRMSDRDAIVVDPMLATGNSAIAAIKRVQKENPRSTKFVCLLAAPEGIKNLQEACPDVEIFTASVDERLNEKGYILPGLGDAGDRLFGTK